MTDRPVPSELAKQVFVLNGPAMFDSRAAHAHGWTLKSFMSGERFRVAKILEGPKTDIDRRRNIVLVMNRIDDYDFRMQVHVNVREHSGFFEPPLSNFFNEILRDLEFEVGTQNSAQFGTW